MWLLYYFAAHLNCLRYSCMHSVREKYSALFFTMGIKFWLFLTIQFFVWLRGFFGYHNCRLRIWSHSRVSMCMTTWSVVMSDRFALGWKHSDCNNSVCTKSSIQHRKDDGLAYLLFYWDTSIWFIHDIPKAKDLIC